MTLWYAYIAIGPSDERDRARRSHRLRNGAMFFKPQWDPFVATDRRDVTPGYGWLRGTSPDLLAKIMTAHDNQQLDLLLVSAIAVDDKAQEKLRRKGYDWFGVWPATKGDHYVNRMRLFLSRSDHVVNVVRYYIDQPANFDERGRIAHFERWVRVAEVC